MIGFVRSDGVHVWLAPAHVTLIQPAGPAVTAITLDCGTVVEVHGMARDVAAMIAADTVATADAPMGAVHPLEIE